MRPYNRPMNRPRIAGRVSANWLILIAALAAGLGLWLGMRAFAPAGAALPTLQSMVPFPHPRALPDFELARSDGARLTRADWTGRWTIAFFGYTNCPDVCPTTLATFAQAWKKLNPAARGKLRFDFISVDPARDTPPVLKQFVSAFHPRLIGLTGTDAEIAAVAKLYAAPYSKQPAPKGATGYLMQHSTAAILFGPDGQPIALVPVDADAKTVAATLDQWVR